LVDIFTVDFETYYDKDFSLSKMSTEDYVMDDRFEIIMVGVKKNDEQTEVLSFTDTSQYRQALIDRGVHRGAVLCHNTLFDGLILAARLQIIPPMLLDTLAMAQATLKPFHRSISLASCLKHRKSPLAKGTYVGNMLGRRLASLSPLEFREYAQYCSDDCDGEYWLFQDMKEMLPRDEYLIIDMTLRMYLEPQFVLDADTCNGVLADEREKKRKLLKALPNHVEPSDLTSNPKFAKVLEKFGVEVPYKISPTTLKPTYAFAKNDPEFKDLEDEYADDPIVSSLLAARLGVKSTIGETRARRFLDIAQQYRQLRVPLRYYGAHTGRYSGMEKINCQNLPRIPRGATNRNHLRYAVTVPEGYVVLASDLSQIEARMNAWLSNCTALLGVFANKGDPYCAFATRAYGREIIKGRDDHERFIGKTCVLGLGYGMGAKKLQATLRKDGVKMEFHEVQRLVDVYRETFHEIPALWRRCDEIIKQMAAGEAMCMVGPVMCTKDRLTLPNGMAIYYHNLRFIDTSKYRGWSFTYAERPKTIWGGTMVENLCQALARITITEHMLNIRKRLNLRPALQAHDELVYVVKEKFADRYREALEKLMRTPPSFAPDLPIDAEAAWGQTYGDAK
jgi:DNA polymerase